jgi:hypothetical protein
MTGAVAVGEHPQRTLQRSAIRHSLAGTMLLILASLLVLIALVA